MISKMLKPVTFAGSEYEAEQSDIIFVNSVIAPKLSLGKEVNIFCSFSYFTPNYADLFFLRELAELSKKKCNLYLILWDINAETHPYFIKIINERHISPEQMILEKIEEIKAIFRYLGAPENRINLYRATEVLNRFIKKQTPNLFVKYYEAVEKMSLNELVLEHKISHLIQMPLDLFYAYFLQELYPEDVINPIECIICYDYQYEIYAAMRTVLQEKGLGKNIKPVILICPSHPYLVKEGGLPELDMSKEAVVQQMLFCNPSLEEINKMYQVVLQRVLSEFELLEKNGKISVLKLSDFLKQNKTLPLENQLVSLGYNLYSYLQYFGKKLESGSPERITHLTSVADTVKLAKVLSSKRLVEVFQTIDGEKNATQLAKQLKIARSNMSKYLKVLNDNHFIEIDSGGIIRKKIYGIRANFEVGLN
ncbi:MAG: winged helix-turn-helix domain-containing protein [Nanoarchaeota archaeon]